MKRTLRIGDIITTKNDGTYMVWKIDMNLRIVIGLCDVRGRYRQFDFRELGLA